MYKRLTLIPLLIFSLHAGPASAFGIPALLGLLFKAGTTGAGAAAQTREDAPRLPPSNAAAEAAAQKARVAELKAQLSAAIEQVEARTALTPLQREWEIIRLEDHYYDLMQPNDTTVPGPTAKASDSSPLKATAEAEDFFAPDRGLRLHVEFVGSRNLTERLRHSLRRRGHILADNAMVADVVFRVEGQFRLDETALFEGLTIDAGAYYDAPQSLPPLKEKPGVRARRALAATLQTLGGQGIAPPPRNDIFQAALVVAARQAPGEKEYRIFSMHDGTFPESRADALLHDAIAEILTRLGVTPDSPSVAPSVSNRTP